jgi:hypothetical protein
MKAERAVMAPICPYCNSAAELMRDSTPVYGMDYGPVWICRPCNAWVGVHKDSPRFAALGRLANAELRKAKTAAHDAFDRLWQAKIQREGCSRKTARRAGYRWLAEQLGIPGKECHIGMFDVATCRRVVEICTPYLRGRS